MDSDSIAVIVENNGARIFRNTYKNNPDYSLNISYALVNKTEIVEMMGEVPSSLQDVYWWINYAATFTNPKTHAYQIAF